LKKNILENYLDGKLVWIENLLALKKIKSKNIYIKNLHALRNYFHWKTIYIEILFVFKI
jgi:hypothetical protein